MNIVIRPLSEAYLEKACRLVDRCFPDEPVHPDLTVRESMDKNRHLRKKILDEYGERIDAIDFWVAIDAGTDAVIGTSGLYEDMHDEYEASWMEWFCVDPSHRGHGVGALLLEKAIDEAKKRRKKFLRLYTLEAAAPTVAQHLYAQHGFAVFKRAWDAKRNAYLLFMQKELAIE